MSREDNNIHTFLNDIRSNLKSFTVSIIGVIFILITNILAVDTTNSVVKRKNFIIPTYKEWEDPKIFEINRGKIGRASCRERV